MKLLDKLLNAMGKLVPIHFRSSLTQIQNNTNNGFADLAPINNAPDCDSYFEALDWALSNINVQNIALSGNYGSGKSSILKTFEIKYPKYQYLNISLASFQHDSVNKSDENKEPDTIQSSIELSILQQMFYRVKSNTIPDSRFRRIKRLSGWGLMARLIVLILGLLSLLDLLIPKFLNEKLHFKSTFFGVNSWSDYLSIIFILLGLVLVAIYIFRLLQNARFNKLNFIQGEIEVENNSDKSILNKYFDEIIYFFRCTQYNVVIFEDLDRFENPDIFVKLRELNRLLNNSDDIDRKITFLYSIKDEMFTDKLRTKFFEFILPVIPVVNSSNSLELLLNKFKSHQFDISESFLSDISLFIDDMRVLKNIFNEFLIYEASLQQPKINHEKLLSIVTFKNLYPIEFAQLLNGKGILLKILNSKTDIIKEFVKQIRKEIAVLTEKNKEISNTTTEDITDLRKIYIFEIIKEIPKIEAFSYEKKTITISQALEDNFFNSLVSNDTFTFFQHESYQRQEKQGPIKFSEISKKLDPSKTYSQRADNINARNNGEIDQNLTTIGRLNKEIDKYHNLSIKDILNLFPNGLDTFKDVLADKKLLVYLVRNGYLDEDYETYISHFYEGSMTKKDKQFLYSVVNLEPLPFDFNISNLEKILGRLKINDCQTPAILNRTLIDYLLSPHTRFSDFLTALMSQLTDKSSTSIAFINHYLENGSYKERFVTLLIHDWPDFSTYLLTNNLYTETHRNEILGFILTRAPLKDLTKSNSPKVISNYLETRWSLIRDLEGNNGQNNIPEVIEALDVHFDYLQLRDSSQELLNCIYQHNLYIINEHNVLQILEKETKLDQSDFRKSNYTSIVHSGLKFLIEYIENNIGTYISDVFLSIKENNTESEDSFVTLLNNDNLNSELKEKIIESQVTQITDIGVIQDSDLWGILFKSLRIEPSWENVDKYHKQFEIIDDNLVTFLNDASTIEALSNKPITDGDLFAAIVIIPQISDDLFKILVESSPHQFDSDEFNSLNRRKVEFLIKSNSIPFNKTNYEILKQSYPNNQTQLALNNIESFIAQIGDFEIDAKDLFSFLNSPIDIKKKVLIIRAYGIQKLENDANLCSACISLFNKTEPFQIDLDLLEILIKDRHENDEALQLLLTQISYFSNGSISKLFQAVGGDWRQLTEGGLKHRILNSPIQLDLVEKLEAKRYLTSFNLKDSEIIVMRKKNLQ